MIYMQKKVTDFVNALFDPKERWHHDIEFRLLKEAKRLAESNEDNKNALLDMVIFSYALASEYGFELHGAVLNRLQELDRHWDKAGEYGGRSKLVDVMREMAAERTNEFFNSQPRQMQYFKAAGTEFQYGSGCGCVHCGKIKNEHLNGIFCGDFQDVPVEYRDFVSDFYKNTLTPFPVPGNIEDAKRMQRVFNPRGNWVTDEFGRPRGKSWEKTFEVDMTWRDGHPLSSKSVEVDRKEVWGKVMEKFNDLGIDPHEVHEAVMKNWTGRNPQFNNDEDFKRDHLIHGEWKAKPGPAAVEVAEEEHKFKEDEEGYCENCSYNLGSHLNGWCPTKEGKDRMTREGKCICLDSRKLKLPSCPVHGTKAAKPPEETPFKVRIKKARSRLFWYNNMIGQVFDVVFWKDNAGASVKKYKVFDPNNSKESRLLDIGDCEIVFTKEGQKEFEWLNCLCQWRDMRIVKRDPGCPVHANKTGNTQRDSDTREHY